MTEVEILGEGEKLGFGEFSFNWDNGDETIRIYDDSFDNPDALMDIDYMNIDLDMKDFQLPEGLTSEFDMDDLGISEIEGGSASLSILKDDEKFTFKSETSSAIGDFEIEMESNNISDRDPNIELYILLDDVEDILESLGINENKLEFEYDGKSSELQIAFMEYMGELF